MKENKGFWIVILGRYSLMREGISRVLEAEGFRVQVSEPGAGHLRIRTRAPRLLFLIVHSGDDFSGVVAEIELPAEDAPFERPAWLGAEVTHDARYFNSALAARPYAQWRAEG